MHCITSSTLCSVGLHSTVQYSTLCSVGLYSTLCSVGLHSTVQYCIVLFIVLEISLPWLVGPYRAPQDNVFAYKALM